MFDFIFAKNGARKLGLRDRGKVRPIGYYKKGELCSSILVCGICNTVLRVGITKEENYERAVRYCWRCEQIIDVETTYD